MPSVGGALALAVSESDRKAGLRSWSGSLGGVRHRPRGGLPPQERIVRDRYAHLDTRGPNSHSAESTGSAGVLPRVSRQHVGVRRLIGAGVPPNVPCDVQRHGLPAGANPARQKSDLVPSVKAYSRIVAVVPVAVARISLRGKRIGQIRAWNGVDGPLKRLPDSAPSDLKVIL